MKESKRNAWPRIVFSLALACLFGTLVHVTLMRLSTTAADDPANWGNENPPPTLLNDTDVYTTFLPIVFKNLCTHESSRQPLQDTGNFPGEVEIRTPLHCTTGFRAESHIPVTGTYTGTPDGVTLWVLAYPTAVELYYPQSPDPCAGEPPFQDNGFWRVPAFLGEKGGPPEWFDIVVVLTDQESSDFLDKWVKAGCQRGEYWGVPATELEKRNITEKIYISVQTAD